MPDPSSRQAPCVVTCPLCGQSYVTRSQTSLHCPACRPKYQRQRKDAYRRGFLVRPPAEMVCVRVCSEAAHFVPGRIYEADAIRDWARYADYEGCEFAVKHNGTVKRYTIRQRKLVEEGDIA